MPNPKASYTFGIAKPCWSTIGMIGPLSHAIIGGGKPTDAIIAIFALSDDVEGRSYSFLQEVRIIHRPIIEIVGKLIRKFLKQFIEKI